MKRFASVGFDGVLGADERDAAARTYLSAGATQTSWAATKSRSYLTLRVAADHDVRALAVLRIVPDARRLLPALLSALGGPGAPAGVREAYRDGDAVVVEFDPRRSPLALVVAVVDAELRSAPGRAIEPLVPFDDETLAAFAGTVLREPALDASRIIETYLEPLAEACGR